MLSHIVTANRYNINTSNVAVKKKKSKFSSELLNLFFRSDHKRQNISSGEVSNLDLFFLRVLFEPRLLASNVKLQLTIFELIPDNQSDGFLYKPISLSLN